MYSRFRIVHEKKKQQVEYMSIQFLCEENICCKISLLSELELRENGSFKVSSKLIFSSSKIHILFFKIIYRLFRTDAYNLKTFLNCYIY